MKRLPQLTDVDLRRLKKLLADGQLLPVLNDTKWSELIAEMLNGREMQPQFRTRSVFATERYVSDWDGEWYHHTHPVAELEWIELRARSEEWLFKVLRMHGIPFSIEDGIVRVWGYTRPGRQPCWQ